MEWFEVTIHTDTKALDILTGVLLDLGIDSFITEDKEDFANFLSDTTIYWDYVDEDLMKEKSSGESKIKFYMDDIPETKETLESLKKQLIDLHKKDIENEYGALELSYELVYKEDWENNWKQYFKPFKVGEKFVIKPSWETVENTENRIILEIDPASSFGTGSHETTKLCICQLEKYVKGGEKILDMGVGSGILSIAAHLLGAEKIVAVDIDENCIKTAKENGEKNNFSLETYCGDIVLDSKLNGAVGKNFDIITANIVADVICSMSDIFYNKLKPNGILITSGIISGREEDVKKALIETGFKIIDINVQGDWTEVTATR